MMFDGNGRVENNEKDIVSELKKPIGVKTSDETMMNTKFVAAMNNSAVNNGTAMTERTVVETPGAPVVEASQAVNPTPATPVTAEATVVGEPTPVAEPVTPVTSPSIEAQAEEAKYIFDRMVEETPVVANKRVDVPEVAIPGMEANTYVNPAAPVMQSTPVVGTPVARSMPETPNVNPDVTLSTPQDLYQTGAEPVVPNDSPAFEKPTGVTTPIVEFPVAKDTPVQETVVNEVASVTQVEAKEEADLFEKSNVIMLSEYKKLKKQNENQNEKIRVLEDSNREKDAIINGLTNQLAIANQRASIAEGARQQAFSQAAPQAYRVFTPETNVDMAA